MKKKIISLILVLLVAVSMTAFAGGRKKAEETTKEMPEIGLAWDLIQISRLYMRDRVMLRASELGAKITFTVADNDVAKQHANIEGLIAKGVDAIICIPIDSKAIAASIRLARDAGIPFITIDRTTSPDAGIKPDYFAATESYQQAYDATSALGDIIDADGVEPKFIEIIGALNDENAKKRHDGFQKVCEERGYEVVAEVPSDWNLEKARSGFQNALLAHPEFNALFTPSDYLNPSVVGVLQAANRWFPYGTKGHIYIASQDVFPSGWKYVRDGYFDTDTLWDEYVFAGTSVDAAMKLINGEELEQTEFLVIGRTITRENVLTEPNVWGHQLAE